METTIVANAVEEQKELREYTEEELTRTFTISEECYNILRETVDDADARGLNSSMQFWLERFVKQHSKVQANLWKKADDQSIFSQAQRGSNQAKLAVLASLGIKGDAATELLKRVK